ncbi:MAG: DNA-directed RNA polymerase subunit alpha [Candidatus Daviesbacteria bacterium]|nr:DNA-directed RNA polymerase subunit alpha [Candidatus Daviesbacteria bacterium]
MINFKIEKQEQTGNTGVFVLEPLEKGFGQTVASCLRRVLLAALEGAAITSVKIDGVSHQFSTITGISEDVIQIILNLKKVRLKVFGDNPIKLILKASGKGEVRAKAIDGLGAGEVVNPDLYIASLNSTSAKLNIEMTAQKGVGYVLADEKKTDEIGVIPIDSIYTPVTSVVYKVEPTRVGRSSNYDKITMTIGTDGTVLPEDALLQSAKILSQYFKQVYDPAFEEEPVKLSTVNDSVLKMSVEELDLPVRITNALKAIDIDNVEKLTSTPKSQLLKAKNLGVQSLNLILQKLSERGLLLSEA